MKRNRLRWFLAVGLVCAALSVMRLSAAPVSPNGAAAQPEVDPLPDKYQFSIGAQGAVGRMDGPLGVAVGPAGHIYVADTKNARIQEFTSDGVFLNTWGSQGSAEGQLANPHDVAVDGYGTSYVADAYNHRVQFFNSEGEALGGWGRLGYGAGEFIWPSGVAIAPNGEVYVVDAAAARVQRFTSAGGYLGSWGVGGSADGQLYRPEGIAIAPDGTVYIADTENDRIQRFSATGSFLGKWGVNGTGAGQFDYPTDVAVAADGTVVVVDTWNNRVQRFTATGAYLGAWGQFGVGDGQFYHPWGIATAPDGSIYVSEREGNRVQRFTVDGQFRGRWGGADAGLGRLSSPWGVAVAGDGSIYVADRFNRRIQKFGANGLLQTAWGSAGMEDGNFLMPSGVAVTPAGSVYVIDPDADRVQQFAATGGFIRKWGSYGTGNGQFSSPYGIAVAPDGSVYVADTYNHRIQRFTAQGAYLTQWGRQGNGNGEFSWPTGVQVAASGDVFVADQWNSRIQRFSATGQFKGIIGAWGSGDGQFQHVIDTFIASDGTLYASDVDNHRIQRFTTDGAYLGQWGTFGGGPGQFTFPHGLAAAAGGTMWVVDESNSRVSAYAPEYATDWRGEFFDNIWLTGRPVAVQYAADLNFEWQDAAPAPGVPPEDFGSRFQKTTWFEAGRYRFTIFADEGIRFWVDNALVLQEWTRGQRDFFTFELQLTQGYHHLRTDHFDSGGWASLALWWVQLDDYEPDDGCAVAKEIGVNGAAQRHTFHAPVDQDWVRFNVQGGRRYVIETRNLAQGVDTKLTLYRGDGSTLIAFNDDDGGTLASRIVYDALAGEGLCLQVEQLSGVFGPSTYYDLAVSDGLIPTATATRTDTPLPTATHTNTPVPTATNTNTPHPTATHTDMPKPTATHTDTPPPTATHTMTPGTPTLTPTPGAQGDVYEADNTCALARFIPVDGTVQHHTFHRAADTDWVAFNATAGTRYNIQGDPAGLSPVDLVVQPYPYCGGSALPGQDYSFSPGIRLEFQAQNNGPIYLKLVNHDSGVGGDHAAYDISVRAASPTQERGALVLVAGRRRDGDLQTNINAVAAHVYRVFLNHGYTGDDINYLTTDLSQPGADTLVTRDDLRAAITDWANARVGPNRPLTLYLVDHGEHDRFMLDDARGEYLAPEDLDAWLGAVEGQHPGLKVNVIIEACQSGSFIDLPRKVSGPGRVVITSTSAERNAYASPSGANFSDQFLNALDLGSSLYTAFQNARWSASVASAENQTPWLDDNGNGAPNEAADGVEAQRRGFSFTGTLAVTQWPPYIAEVTPPVIQDGRGTVRARVLDDKGPRHVWAVFYPPSYTPPPPGSEWVDEELPTLPLQDQGGGWFGVTYGGFTEAGPYRVVVFAEDGEGLSAQPRAMRVGVLSLYLPMVVR